MSRIYGGNRSFDIEPNMDQNHAKTIREHVRKRTLIQLFLNQMIRSTALTLGNAIYHNLQKGFDLLGTDRVLASDPRAQVYVNLMAYGQELFYSHFITAMIEIGVIGVKTGNVGEMRKDCGSSADNSVYSISNKQTVYGLVL